MATSATRYILINMLLHLIRHKTTEKLSRRSFLHNSKMLEENGEPSLADSGKPLDALNPSRDAASEAGVNTHYYHPRNILDYFKLWKKLAMSAEADNAVSESSPTHKNTRSSSVGDGGDLAADPIDQDLDPLVPGSPTTSGYTSRNQTSLGVVQPQVEGTTHVTSKNKGSDVDDDGANTDRDLDAFHVPGKNSRLDNNGSKKKDLNQKSRKDFTMKNDDTEDSHSGSSLQSHHYTRKTTLPQETTPHSPIRSPLTSRQHNPFCRKNHVQPHTTVQPLRSDTQRNRTTRHLRIIPSTGLSDSNSAQSLDAGGEKNAQNKDWIHVKPKGLAERMKTAENEKPRKRERERKEGMSDDGEMGDEYCSSQFLLSIYMGC